VYAIYLGSGANNQKKLNLTLGLELASGFKPETLRTCRLISAKNVQSDCNGFL